MDDKRSKQAGRERPDHVIPGVPGGNVQNDPAEQSHRRDMAGDERDGPEGSYRGNLPPRQARPEDLQSDVEARETRDA